MSFPISKIQQHKKEVAICTACVSILIVLIRLIRRKIHEKKEEKDCECDF